MKWYSPFGVSCNLRIVRCPYDGDSIFLRISITYLADYSYHNLKDRNMNIRCLHETSDLFPLWCRNYLYVVASHALWLQIMDKACLLLGSCFQSISSVIIFAAVWHRSMFTAWLHSSLSICITATHPCYKHSEIAMTNVNMYCRQVCRARTFFSLLVTNPNTSKIL
jgi:hypothetical protein